MGKFEDQAEVVVRMLAELEVVRMILTKAGVVSEADYDKAVDDVEAKLLEAQAQIDSAFDCFDDEGDLDEEPLVVDSGKIHEA